ncbi:hypothetical protein ASPSYDRAFT_88724 [Aspergillus sydowii CBS 593.65]|uniref:Invertebrate defensins family profile domain-containing protein n=1 Tax=Aspergillus sydowii CBS 593.65 TaxID=1036612 RepID=A0A1L9TK82_9EURO|nr:uncharacterized protein ASPSYDRAFT_88724 [Aspergillus sydowii CBS 593.65]OJJ59825.1 hypothetical protein ASPSYDRAFT_88724 [Aspergillus sydowii CBS 593.65]
MQFSAIVLSAVALFGSMALAAPAPAPAELEARSSCQIGDIFGAGDAACSASCLKDGTYHGGYCNDEK